MAGYYDRSAPDEGADDELSRYKRWYRADIARVNAWRREAREDFRFRDGHQWSREDRQVLEEQGRPCITFNRTGVLVDAVVGAESSNRREVRYIPRESGDALANEILTSAADWFRDQCDAEDEESEAFKDTVTAGMGWTETRLDRTSNPDGEPRIERLDPFEMVWSDGTKANLVDSKRRWRVRCMDIAEAQRLFPDASPEDLNAAWADNQEDDDPSHHPHHYEGRTRADDSRVSRKVTVVACQWVEEEPYYKALIVTPPAAEPQLLDLDEAKFRIAEKLGAVLQSVRLKRETVLHCVLGARMLIPPTPTPTGTFTWNCITGLKDADKGIFYGVIRRAKDPQRWANKWLSQILHILNSQAKGGIMAERGAFEDDREAEASWARADRITYMAQGALQGGRVSPKPALQFPAGFDRLMAYADDMIIKATGINMELLGMREVNQPGVLEYQRKQSGMGILASFFDSLRRYRKIQGRCLLRLIQRFLADGRMVRIVGQDRAEFVPLTREQVASVDYDIIVDDAPTAPNEREKNWQIIQAMLPLVKDMIGPEQAMILAKYSPLPASFVEELKKSLAEKQADPQQDAAAQMNQVRMQLEGQKLQLDMARIEADRERTAMEARKVEVEAQKAALEQETERMRIEAERMAAMATFPATVQQVN